MATSSVPLGKARTDLSELCSRAAFGGSRIVLTRHGRPAAALVSMDDLAVLETPPTVQLIESADVPAQLGAVWQAFMPGRSRSGWWAELDLEGFDGGDVTVWGTDYVGRVVSLVHRELIRVQWADGGEVSIYFADRGGATSIRVEHGMEPEFWRERLSALRSYLSSTHA